MRFRTSSLFLGAAKPTHYFLVVRKSFASWLRQYFFSASVATAENNFAFLTRQVNIMIFSAEVKARKFPR
jgi:hypothetical protein